MTDKENFLEHTFHDSYLKGMEEKENKTTLIIDTDIYWYPGKPFTLLTLVNAENTIRVKELVGGDKNTSFSINEARMERSEKDEKNFKLDIEFHEGVEVSVHCYNFWTERKEEYKDYGTTVFR